MTVGVVNSRQWQLDTLTGQYLDSALSLVCSEFFPNSALHQAVGMCASEFEAYMTREWQSNMLKCPLPGIVAADSLTNDVIGCLIPAPFPSDFSDIERLPNKRRSIALLLQTLEARFLQDNPHIKNAVMIDIAVVNEVAGGRGIYQAMRKEFQRMATANGYEYVIGSLSSTVTQHVCVDKLGHRVMSEIRFAELNDHELRPFSAITNPRSIQLVVCSLAQTESVC